MYNQDLSKISTKKFYFFVEKIGWIWLYELKVKKYRHFFGYGDIYILEVKEKVVYLYYDDSSTTE